MHAFLFFFSFFRFQAASLHCTHMNNACVHGFICPLFALACGRCRACGPRPSSMHGPHLLHGAFIPPLPPDSPASRTSPSPPRLRLGPRATIHSTDLVSFLSIGSAPRTAMIHRMLRRPTSSRIQGMHSPFFSRPSTKTTSFSHLPPRSLLTTPHQPARGEYIRRSRSTFGTSDALTDPAVHVVATHAMSLRTELSCYTSPTIDI